MHRSVARRAAWPLVVAILAFTSSAALGADASWSPASTRPTATSPGNGAVEAVTLSAAGAAIGSAVLGVLRSDANPEDAYGWRSGWAPPAPQLAAPTTEKPRHDKTSKPKSTAQPSAPAAPKIWWKQYQGTNHVWMPTLGINRSVYYFSCTRSRDPDNLVYRWGCAGSNNIYLLGHAYGVFKALHDSYYNGKLKKGMPVIYANGNGVEHLYRVRSWRVVDPYEGTAWAIASQSVPSMTLQTCIGKNDAYRLNVRLVRVD